MLKWNYMLFDMEIIYIFLYQILLLSFYSFFFYSDENPLIANGKTISDDHKNYHIPEIILLY